MYQQQSPDVHRPLIEHPNLNEHNNALPKMALHLLPLFCLVFNLANQALLYESKKGVFLD